MRDIALFIIVVGLCALAFVRPWLGVVGLALLGAMHPQSYGGEWMARFPAYKLLFVTTCVSAAIDCWRMKQWPRLWWDWRLIVLALLFADFALTTWFALLPETARGRLVEVSMLIPPLLLTLWLIDTREELHYVVIAMAAGVALVALKGGYWAVMTGFNDRVYGPPGSQIGGNNEFAVALAMTIPLLVLWLRQTNDRALRWTLIGAITLCYIAAVTSWSRAALITLAVMSALLVWHSKRKYASILLVALGVAVAAVNLPEKWLARMETIATYQQDQSFQGRQEAWRQGLQYLQRNPWMGSGFDGWRAVTAQVRGGGDVGVLDWHSAYVEIAVEHGIPGLLLWGTLLGGTMIGLWRMAHQGKRIGDAWMSDYGGMLCAALAAYMAGGLTLGITYWELLFQLLALSIVALRLTRSPATVVPTAGY